MQRKHADNKTQSHAKFTRNHENIFASGITYDNECMLRTQACREQSLVSVKYEVMRLFVGCMSNKLQGVCSNCHPQLDWRCSDTTCINNTQVCDGREDCSDGGDEQYCNFICFNMQTIEMKVGCVLELSTKI